MGLLEAAFGALICIGVGYVAGRLSAAPVSGVGAEAPASGTAMSESGGVAPEPGDAIGAAPAAASPFATPPLAATRLDALPKPRAARKPVGQRTRSKPRSQAIKSNGAAASAAPIDTEASPP